ncbi:hypothetical protein J2X69_000441 [Algoriphagus sp. 4150]|nr:hypothetical protein [Algoriphagus sp. 4150]
MLGNIIGHVPKESGLALRHCFVFTESGDTSRTVEFPVVAVRDDTDGGIVLT